ncbi:MAG: retropepsin-like aspartic protease [bacterium]
MHIKTPFTKLTPEDSLRPWLPVIIINSHTGKKIKILGLVDTGADECALPARYASLLGHNLEAGFSKEINTGNGVTIAYSHTIDIEVEDYVIKGVLIDFMPNLHTPLLGVKSFLSKFILTVDYHKSEFSLKN